MALSWYIVQGDKSKPANRCRKWYVVVRKKGGGTRSSTFHGTKTDARKWAPTFAAQVEEECGRASCRTFGEFARAWNDARFAAGEISENTHRNYARAFELYAGVAAMPLAEVDAAAVDADTARVLLDHSASSANVLHVCVCAALGHAAAIGLIPSNPGKGSSRPRPSRRPYAVAPPEAVAALLALPPDDCRAFAASLALRAGLRRKEILGATWGDVSGGRLRVRREATKTDAGARSVPLDAATLRLVGERRAMLEALNGEVPPDAQLVCADDLSETTRHHVERWWAANRAALGCEGLRLHDLRHTYLTNLAQAGVHPSVMQRLAGHSTPTVAMQVYTHVQDADLADAVDAMAAWREAAKNRAKRDGAEADGNAV